jgi:lysophospholipase L1-like esterase
MKRIISIIAAGILFPLIASAQDWANTARYAQENKLVSVKPKAVFMGDSITQCWPDYDPTFFTDNNFLCRGISGQTTSHMLCRFRKDVLALAPEYVVILGGTNDIALNNGPMSVEDIYNNIISMCEIATVNGVVPVICSVLPSKGYHWRPEVTDVSDQIIKLNSMLKNYASQKHVLYVDYHSVMKDAENGLPEDLSYDGCHATLKGYKIMEEIVLRVLK